MLTFSNSMPQLLIGIVYGYYYLKTNSLWAPWIAHTISNSILNFVHVTTTTGLDAGLMIRMPVTQIVMLLTLFWVKRLAEKHQMKEIQPWQ